MLILLLMSVSVSVIKDVEKTGASCYITETLEFESDILDFLEEFIISNVVQSRHAIFFVDSAFQT